MGNEERESVTYLIKYKLQGGRESDKSERRVSRFSSPTMDGATIITKALKDQVYFYDLDRHIQY